MENARPVDHTRCAIARWAAGLIVLASMLMVMSLPARAAFEASDLQSIATAGRVLGSDDNEAVDISELRLGLGRYFRDRLGLYGELSLYRPTGWRDSRSVDTVALGFAFALRWHFLRRPGFSLYTDWGIGLMVGVDRFPPAGTHYNGTPHFGLGLNGRLREDIRLLVGLRRLHISNGKGYVPENPSFDGLGAYLGVALRPGARAVLPPERAPVPFGGGNLRIRVDATLEHADEENSPGGNLALGLSLFPAAQLRAQLAFSAAELVGEALWEVAVLLYRETASGRVALGYSRQGFSVFRSDHYHLLIMRVLSDINSLEFMVNLERKNLDDDRASGGLFIVSYPIDALALRTGIGFERREDEFFDAPTNLNDACFNFGMAWSPGPMADLGLSLFLDGAIGYGLRRAGLRFQPGRRRSLRERHRRGSLLLLR